MGELWDFVTRVAKAEYQTAGGQLNLVSMVVFAVALAGAAVTRRFFRLLNVLIYAIERRGQYRRAVAAGRPFTAKMPPIPPEPKHGLVLLSIVVLGCPLGIAAIQKL